MAELWRKSRILATPFAVISFLALASPGSADENWSSGWPPGQPSNAIVALAASPVDPAIAYAGTPAGVYRTGNGGASWTVLGGTTGKPVALAIAANTPATLYLYTEQSDAGGTRGMIWRSDDAGSTWLSPGRASPATMGISTLAVDLDSPQTAVAGTTSSVSESSRILKTDDGGITWRQVYTVASVMGGDSVTAIAQGPADSHVWFAGHTVYHGGSLARSQDDGETWQSIATPNEPLAFPSALAVAPDDANVVYVAYQLPTGSGVRLYKTADAGRSWNPIASGLPLGRANSPRLRADPAGGARLFFAVNGDAGGIFTSGDGGQSWTSLSPPGAITSVTALSASAGGQVLYVGSAQGVWQFGSGQNGQWAIDAAFVGYYRQHDGLRVLGRPISGPATSGGYRAQYFEKGRIEDHAAETKDPTWRFMFGLLADELQLAQAPLAVGGDSSTVTYQTLAHLAFASLRVPVPPWFAGGALLNTRGDAFVPFSADLSTQPGHNVPKRFWDYINRQDLFPGGWLHDVGLPITEPLTAIVDKGDAKRRTIIVQAFQRTVLTDDALNPPEWQIERANIGADYLNAR